MADESRLMILIALGEREHNVTELQRRLGVSQPLTSSNLAILRQLGLVRRRRLGKKTYYRLGDAVTAGVSGQVRVALGEARAPVGGVDAGQVPAAKVA